MAINPSFKSSRGIIKIGAQILLMSKEFPFFKCTYFRGKCAIWKGKVRPDVLSREYTVNLSYAEGEAIPKVQIIFPELTHKYGKIPHIYSDTGGLCLFYLGDDNEDKIWRPNKPLTMIVPWILLWLIFYEVFEVTGKWEGGGIGHGNPTSK